MGVLAAIGSGVAIANGVATVLERLDGDRSVVLEVQNHTSKPLRVLRHHHDHGGFAEPPNQEIPPGMVDLFGSQDRGFLTGTEGRVVYQSEDKYFLRIAWNNSFIGSNQCGHGVSGEKAAAFKATAICGSGNVGAHMKYEVRQVLDPKFVRSPDYIWIRLHGYAHAPGTTGLGDVVELHNWWSDER